MTDLQSHINDLVSRIYENDETLMGDMIGVVPIPFSENSCLYEGHRISFRQMCEIFNELLEKPADALPPAEALELLACFMAVAEVNSLFLSGQDITGDKLIGFACSFDYGRRFDKSSVFRSDGARVAFDAYAQKLNRIDTGAGLELAAYALAELEIMKPFKIANGHCARMMMNYVLLRNEIPWIFFEENDKAQYDEALNQYKQSGDLKRVIELIATVAQRQLRPWLKDCTASERAWREALAADCRDIFSSGRLLNLARLQSITKKR